MLNSEYNNLTWPSRVKFARLALPKPTKKALAAELQVTVHTVINWETGKTVPNKKYRERIKDLCCNSGIPTPNVSINFLLGGYDANEDILTRPLITRDKTATMLALLAIATRLATHIYHCVDRVIFVTSIDTLFNTYPSAVTIQLTPVEFPSCRFVFRLSHIPTGVNYTLEFFAYENETLTTRHVCDICDKSLTAAVRLLKKLVNKLKK